ncbi:hypothetical protein N9N03_00770 [Chlamydiia bacterium]|nr:hypothetical protein [Chlamydiia bacterium]
MIFLEKLVTGLENPEKHFSRIFQHMQATKIKIQTLYLKMRRPLLGAQWCYCAVKNPTLFANYSFVFLISIGFIDFITNDSLSEPKDFLQFTMFVTMTAINILSVTMTLHVNPQIILVTNAAFLGYHIYCSLTERV